MKTRYVIPLAVVAGVVLGAFGARTLIAEKPPTGYYIAEVFDVTNQDDFNTYAAGVPATIAKYGGRYLVRGGKTQSLEGEPPKRIIVMTFDSAEAAPQMVRLARILGHQADPSAISEGEGVSSWKGSLSRPTNGLRRGARYFFKPAVQFSTTVKGADALGPIGVTRRNRLPSALTSPTMAPGKV
jgi:uncharacterized protein (DUF1330 family)